MNRQLTLWDLDVNQEYDFTGKNVAITGTLVIPRKEVIEILLNTFGSKYATTVGKSTDYLIVGKQRTKTDADSRFVESKKLRKARSFHDSGELKPIIVSQDEFWSIYEHRVEERR